MSYEINIVQAEVERRLKKSGSYYEYPLPLEGKADFVVTTRTNGLWLIECKRNCERIKNTLAQIMFYWAQLGQQYSKALVVPTDTVTDEARRLCEQWNVKIYQVTVQPVFEYEFESMLSGNGNHSGVKEM